MSSEIFGPLGSPKYKEYLNDIQGSGTHLLQLINDILNFSAIAAGKYNLHKADLNANRDAYAQRVDSDYKQGAAADVRGTPALYITSGMGATPLPPIPA